MRQQSFAASATFALALVAAGAIGIGAAPAQARQSAQSEVQATAGPARASVEKKVCKRLETTGTRMTERVCLTEREWKKIEELR